MAAHNYGAKPGPVYAPSSESDLGWQPIETAPKDADVLLLFLDGSGVQPGYWEDGEWLACETHSLTGGKWHATPTHWMPIPAPPVG